MNIQQQENYVKFLRFCAFVVVLFLWGLSVWWSSDGFSVRRPDLQWVGLGLALSVTVAQLVFNRGAINPTLFIVGIAAYVYGIGTNMAGINSALKIDLSIELWRNFPLEAFTDSLILIGLSLVVEIFPESLLLWAIYPALKSPGDFISTLLGGMNLENRPQKGSNMSNYGTQNLEYPLKQNQTFANEQNKRFNGTKQTKQYPYRINWRNIDQNTNIFKVLQCHKEYWNKTGRECPNKTLTRNSGVSKGQVSQIITKLKSNGFS